MPNWSVGDLKVRGTKPDLQEFMGNIDSENYFWIKGTARIFVSEEEFKFNEDILKDNYEGDYCDDGEHMILTFKETQAAWSFMNAHDNMKKLSDISKEFNVDLRVTAWEQGGLFKETLEILNGCPTICSTVQYNDWRWEAERPTMGG